MRLPKSVKEILRDILGWIVTTTAAVVVGTAVSANSSGGTGIWTAEEAVISPTIPLEWRLAEAPDIDSAVAACNLLGEPYGRYVEAEKLAVGGICTMIAEVIKAEGEHIYRCEGFYLPGKKEAAEASCTTMYNRMVGPE